MTAPLPALVGRAGYEWKKLDKAIFQDRCEPCRYPYRARWNSRHCLREAVLHGAEVRPRAEVRRVLLEAKRARGVAFLANGTEQEALASQVVVSAGGIGSPQLLQASGIGSIGQGFFCDPLIADPWGLPPALTLISLAKRLAKHLA